MCKSDDNTPIIRGLLEPNNKLEQYYNILYNFSVYDPTLLPTGEPSNPINVVVKQKINNGSNFEEVSKKTITFSGNFYNEDGRVFTPLYYGDTEIIISYKNDYQETTKTITFTVEKGQYEINPVTTNLALDFNPEGRSNSDDNYQEFNYSDFDANNPVTWTLSPNFNWA
jgi:hypothetical protein